MSSSSSVLISATPGDGLTVLQFFGVSAASIGAGMTDAVIMVFLFESLRVLGADNLIGYVTLALGGLLSVVLAAVAGVIAERTPRHRKYTAVGLLTLGIGSAAVIAFLMADISLNDGPITVVSPSADTPEAPGYSPPAPASNSRASYPSVATLVVLGILYRACIQAAPIVPMTIDSARIIGDTEHFAARRDISLSSFYINYRVGQLIALCYLSFVPRRQLTYLFPILEGAAIAAIVMCIVTVFVTPTKSSSSPSEPLSYSVIVEQVRKDISAVTNDGSVQLRHVYYESFWYGVAFTQIAAITASYYNDVVFNTTAGDVRGTSWAAYAALLRLGLSMIHDALMPLVAFDPAWGAWGVRRVWTVEMLVGTALMVGLFLIPAAEFKPIVLSMLGLLAVPQSAHFQFSLLGAGALVAQPRLRAASFGVRLFAMHAGGLVGAFVAGAITIAYGFEAVFLLSAAMCLFAAFQAYRIGSFDKPGFVGVAANANPLFSYIGNRAKGETRPNVGQVYENTYVPEPATYMFAS